MRGLGILIASAASAAALSCSDVPLAPRLDDVAVSGRITDRDGPALKRALVYFDSGSARGPYAYAYTDSGGRYSFRLPEGPYRVVFGAEGYPYVESTNVVIRGPTATVDYRYSGLRVSGSIVGPSGQFIAAEVSAYGSAGSNVGATSRIGVGHYSLLLPPGLYGIHASSARYESGVPSIDWTNVPVASDTTIDITLGGFTVITTTTVSGGTPMPGATVEAVNSSVRAAAFTGLDGSAALYLPAGDYTIRALPFQPNIVGPLAITRAIAANDAVAFDFSGPAWDLTIRRASDGALLTGVTVKLDDGVGGRASTRTDAFGRGEFSVRPGVGYTLSVVWADETTSHVSTVPNLSSAADTTFELSLTPDLP